MAAAPRSCLGEPSPDLFAGVQAPSGLGCSPGLAEPGEHVWAVPTSSFSQAHGLAQDARGILPRPSLPCPKQSSPCRAMFVRTNRGIVAINGR